MKPCSGPDSVPRGRADTTTTSVLDLCAHVHGQTPSSLGPNAWYLIVVCDHPRHNASLGLLRYRSSRRGRRRPWWQAESSIRPAPCPATSTASWALTNAWGRDGYRSVQPSSAVVLSHLQNNFFIHEVGPIPLEARQDGKINTLVVTRSDAEEEQQC